ncbi:MAG: hypothetical protein QM504_06645 [Pseudomonadota bacterium]
MSIKLYNLTRCGKRTLVEGMRCEKAYVLTSERKILAVDECSLNNPVFTNSKIAYHCDKVNSKEVPEGAVYLHDVQKIIRRHILIIGKRLDNYSKKTIK